MTRALPSFLPVVVLDLAGAPQQARNAVFDLTRCRRGSRVVLKVGDLNPEDDPGGVLYELVAAAVQRDLAVDVEGTPYSSHTWARALADEAAGAIARGHRS